MFEMVNWTALVSFFLFELALAMKPGPGMLAMASYAMGQGAKPVFIFTVGMNLVKLIFLALVVYGFKIAEEHLLLAGIMIKALAAVYLVFLGVKGLGVSFKDVDTDNLPKPDAKLLTGWDFFISGFLVTISNPLDILFFAGVLPTIVDVTTVTMMDYIMFGIVIFVVETGVAMSYAVPLSMSRKFLKPSLLDRINIGTSIALILAGLIIGYSALNAQDLLHAL